jgi:hypothetical protein
MADPGDPLVEPLAEAAMTPLMAGHLITACSRQLGMRRQMFMTLGLCLALHGAVEAQHDQPLSAEIPEVVVTGPTVIAFWLVPASDAVLEADPGLASALDDQQYLWAETRPQLEAAGIVALDQPGRRFMVREPRRRWVFAANPDSAATGYVLAEPGQEPRVLYGRHFPDEVLAATREVFRTDATRRTHPAARH